MSVGYPGSITQNKKWLTYRSKSVLHAGLMYSLLHYTLKKLGSITNVCYKADFIEFVVRMVNQEEEDFTRQWLSRQNRVSVPNEWLIACIEWLHEENQVWHFHNIILTPADMIIPKGGYCFALWSDHLGCSGHFSHLGHSDHHILPYVSVAIIPSGKM